MKVWQFLSATFVCWRHLTLSCRASFRPARTECDQEQEQRETWGDANCHGAARSPAALGL